jgi:hypothetical protein
MVEADVVADRKALRPATKPSRYRFCSGEKSALMPMSWRIGTGGRGLPGRAYASGRARVAAPTDGHACGRTNPPWPGIYNFHASAMSKENPSSSIV